MSRVSVTADEQAYIQARVDRFVEEAPQELRWQIPHVRIHGALPLYSGWVESVGIRPDGTLVRWSTEEDWTEARELYNATWATTALVQGAERYPKLRHLIPSRPVAAHTCEVCGGTGRFPSVPAIICECGGVGWIGAAG